MRIVSHSDKAKIASDELGLNDKTAEVGDVEIIEPVGEKPVRTRRTKRMDANMGNQRIARELLTVARELIGAKKLTRISGDDVMKEYDKLYGEFSEQKKREKRGDIPKGSFKKDWDDFADKMKDRVDKIVRAIKRGDMDSFRRYVSLSKTNYYGKVTRAIMKAVEIKRARNLDDLYKQMRELV